MQANSENVISFKDFIPLITAIIGSFFLFLGWYITHWLNSIRDRKNKNREIRLQYLIESYRAIIDVNGREDIDYINRLGGAIRDIQLFGSERQIFLLMQSIENYEKGNDNLETLLQSLRNDLRIELDLLQSKQKVIWLVPSNTQKRKSIHLKNAVKRK